MVLPLQSQTRSGGFCPSTVTSTMHAALCLTVLATMLLPQPIGASCPSVCVCNWKAGKRTVECKGQGLDVVPMTLNPATQVLDFTGNNLQELPKQIFANSFLINLQKIYLGDCKIERIHTTAFQQLHTLVDLDLSDNLLTEVPSTAFSNIPNLQSLNLSGNQIRSIHDDSFLHSASLVHLDISNSGIRSISSHAFQSLSLLEWLDMQGNHLHELPNPVVANLGSIRFLEVYNNKWMCDCRVLPLWRLLQNISHSVSPVCTAPSRVNGRAFISLVENDFTCSQEIPAARRTVEGIINMEESGGVESGQEDDGGNILETHSEFADVPVPIEHLSRVKRVINRLIAYDYVALYHPQILPFPEEMDDDEDTEKIEQDGGEAEDIE